MGNLQRYMHIHIERKDSCIYRTGVLMGIILFLGFKLKKP